MTTDYMQRRQAIKLGLVPQQGAKPPKPLKPMSEKKMAEKEQEKKTGKPADKIALGKWFEDIAAEHFGGNDGNCMECGSRIQVQFARHATAHLLPKKLFKSVATHPLNYLILGAGCGCHAKTDRVDLFTKMSVWPEAARRIKEMIPLLPHDELRLVSNQLLKALDNTK